MKPSLFAVRMVDHEVGELVRRLHMIKPFALHETMVPAAQPAGDTLRRIDAYLHGGREALVASALRFRRWLQGSGVEQVRFAAVYRRYVFLRLQIIAALTQLDIFSTAISQRSEVDNGVRLAGLDRLARDALDIDAAPYVAPAMICYLDRGAGAAIRRARTRLPGGGENPVAIIRVPRERMVGLGIASSLVHEAGHQGAALMDLVPTLHAAMEPLLARSATRNPWHAWHRWLSEIVADLWSVARVGIAATMGLINVVSLPRVFVFRGNPDGPHPTPWLRVLLSAEMGAQLYPHPEWHRLVRLWRLMYPQPPATQSGSAALATLMAHVPIFVHWLLCQRVPAAGGRSLRTLLADQDIAPQRLEEHYERWLRNPAYPDSLRPCQLFALLGHGRIMHGRLPGDEATLIERQLRRWALAH